jgi:hypothetical protein
VGEDKPFDGVRTPSPHPPGIIPAANQLDSHLNNDNQAGFLIEGRMPHSFFRPLMPGWWQSS